MSLNNQKVPATTLPLLVVYLILDTSQSVQDHIGSIQNAIPQLVEALKSRYKSCAKVKIACMTFNSEPSWVNPDGPEELEDFVEVTLTAGGLTALGAALTELDEKCSRSHFQEAPASSLMPIFVFMSDGLPTDSWQEPLEHLASNNLWYSGGTKIAFAVGEHEDKGALTQIVGNPEAVIKVDDFETFSQLLVETVVRSSLLTSNSHLTTNNGDKVADDVVESAGGIAATLGMANVHTDTQTIPRSIGSVDAESPASAAADDVASVIVGASDEEWSDERSWG